jgi:two-component system response regulator AlgR
LKSLLVELGYAEPVAEAADGSQALAEAERTHPDVVLLDIVMPVLDGLEVARHLAAFAEPPAVVFCTAYDEHALAAFEASAVDYLVKPVRRERLLAALDRARRFSGERHAELRARLPEARKRTHICARVRGSLKLVPIGDIAYFSAEDKYVLVRHDGGEVLIEDSLKTLEDEFAAQFVRIHRNCLIAKERLLGLKRTAEGRTVAEVRGATQALEVSRRNLAALRDLVRQL